MSPLPDDAAPVVSLGGWLGDDGDELVATLERLYVPRNDPRWLRRNALVALGNGVESGSRDPGRDDPDPGLRAAAQRALGSIAGRSPRKWGEAEATPRSAGASRPSAWRSSRTRCGGRSRRLGCTRGRRRRVARRERSRALALAVAAARDIERILADDEPGSLRREQIDLAALVGELRADGVDVSVAGRPTSRATRTAAAGAREPDRQRVSATARA